MAEDDQYETPVEEPVELVDYKPDSPDESGRKFGMAMSAGIVFFSSILFMLFLGWLADLLFGSSPWGIVAGIVLGSIIGFIQFFRMSSQIFGTRNSPPSNRPLIPKDDYDDRNRS